MVAIDDFGAGHGTDPTPSPAPESSGNCLIVQQDLQRLRHTADWGEKVEAKEEYAALQSCGVDLMQGYLLAKPAFEQLPCYSLIPYMNSLERNPEPSQERSTPQSSFLPAAQLSFVSLRKGVSCSSQYGRDKGIASTGLPV